MNRKRSLEVFKSAIEMIDKMSESEAAEIKKKFECKYGTPEQRREKLRQVEEVFFYGKDPREDGD